MTEVNLKQIAFSVLGILIIIFGLLIWYTSSDYYLKEKYLEFKSLEFRTTVLKKIDEHPVKGNKVYLRNGNELIIKRVIFDRLEKGDSVVKAIDSDSIMFYTSNGVIINDYNEFKREKYLKSIE